MTKRTWRRAGTVVAALLGAGVARAGGPGLPPGQDDAVYPDDPPAVRARAETRARGADASAAEQVLVVLPEDDAGRALEAAVRANGGAEARFRVVLGPRREVRR
jgi:hypothetical protein